MTSEAELDQKLSEERDRRVGDAIEKMDKAFQRPAVSGPAMEFATKVRNLLWDGGRGAYVGEGRVLQIAEMADQIGVPLLNKVVILENALLQATRRIDELTNELAAARKVVGNYEALVDTAGTDDPR
jgi:hypothetical protein